MWIAGLIIVFVVLYERSKNQIAPTAQTPNATLPALAACPLRTTSNRVPLTVPSGSQPAARFPGWFTQVLGLQPVGPAAQPANLGGNVQVNGYPTVCNSSVCRGVGDTANPMVAKLLTGPASTVVAPAGIPLPCGARVMSPAGICYAGPASPAFGSITPAQQQPLASSLNEGLVPCVSSTSPIATSFGLGNNVFIWERADGTYFIGDANANPSTGFNPTSIPDLANILSIYTRTAGLPPKIAQAVQAGQASG